VTISATYNHIGHSKKPYRPHNIGHNHIGHKDIGHTVAGEGHAGTFVSLHLAADQEINKSLTAGCFPAAFKEA